MSTFLDSLRAQVARSWRARLLLGMTFLGLLLAGVSQGEIHAHVDGASTHVHVAANGQEPPDREPHPGDSTSGTLHVHDAAVTLVLLGPPAHSVQLSDVAESWSPDLSDGPPPASGFTAPHRPPIA